MSSLVFDSITDGQNGSCRINGASKRVTYSPNADFYGIDICLYTVCDEDQLCDEAVSYGIVCAQAFTFGRGKAILGRQESPLTVEFHSHRYLHVILN